LKQAHLSKNTAIYLFIILFPIGIVCSYFVNITCFIIALVTALFAIFYDVILKKIKLLGNFFIAYTMAIPFIFGAASVLTETSFEIDLSPAIFIIALIAFLTGAGREIMKDVMDFEGDKEGGVKSFPRYIGIRKSNMISAFFYLIAIILSFLPFFISYYDVYYHNYYYLLIVSLTDMINMGFYRKFTLVAIFFGLIAFLVGAFV